MWSLIFLGLGIFLLAAGAWFTALPKRMSVRRVANGLGMIVASIGVVAISLTFVYCTNDAREAGMRQGLESRASLDEVQRSVKAAYKDDLPPETIRGHDIDGQDPNAE